MTLLEKYKKIQEIGTSVEVPYNVRSLFASGKNPLDIVGSDISLGEDYGSLQQCREAIEWYAGQLGGTVKWSKYELPK